MIDTLSQEMGPAQFELNFLHGNAVELADQVFLFKRTVREAAIAHEMHATFLASPMSEEAGSALHIHQSVVDNDGRNIFSNADGSASRFVHVLHRRVAKIHAGGIVDICALREFLPAIPELLDASPVNLAWAVDNRTVGLRVPDSRTRGASRRKSAGRLGR